MIALGIFAVFLACLGCYRIRLFLKEVNQIKIEDSLKQKQNELEQTKRASSLSVISTPNNHISSKTDKNYET